MGVPSGSKADKKTNGHLVFSLMSGYVSTCAQGVSPPAALIL